MSADNLDELLDDLFDYGKDTFYGVVCDAPGFANRWGFLDDTLNDAKRRAAALQDIHGVPFRAVKMIVSGKIQEVGK
jgi:hypothetical protein